jgi:hypothetical protein
MARTIQQISVDAQILVKTLSEVKIGQEITYEQLSKEIGRDLRNGCSGILQTARNRVFRDHGIHFCVIRGVGLRRSDNHDKVIAASSRFKRVKTQSRKGIAELASVDYEQLSNEDRVKHNSALAQWSVFQHMLTPKAEKLLSKKISEAGIAIPIAKTLELFKE